MALTPSDQAELGMIAPDFSLPDVVDGSTVSRQDHAGKPLLVMFLCNHCPYVKAVLQRLIDLGRDYEGESLGVVAISSNDAERYPQDGPEAMKALAEEHDLPFPYLYDATQEVATAYGARCTPDFFLFGGEHELVYRGRLDDSWRDPGAVTRRDLRAAIDAVLAGDEPDPEQHPSRGCSIKWKF